MQAGKIAIYCLCERKECYRTGAHHLKFIESLWYFQSAMPVVKKLFRARILKFKVVKLGKGLQLLVINFSLEKMAVFDAEIF